MGAESEGDAGAGTAATAATAAAWEWGSLGWAEWVEVRFGAVVVYK